MVGIEYHSKHGKYPSYYHWNKKFENPEFSMDSGTLKTYQTRVGNVIIRPDTSDESISSYPFVIFAKEGITIKDTVVNGISKMDEKKHESENYELVKAIWVDNDSLRIIRLFNDGHYDTLK